MLDIMHEPSNTMQQRKLHKNQTAVRGFFAKATRLTRPNAATFHRGSLLDAIAKALYPWDIDRYPGLHKGLVQLFKGRSYWTIRNWRRGRRPMPAWALDVACTALRERRAALDEVLAAIERERERQALPKHRKGMLEVDPLTGMTKGFRMQRIKKAGP